MPRIRGRLTLFVAISVITFFLLVTYQVEANVDLLYFRAASGTDSVNLEWETASELDNLGFNILRSDTGDIANAEVINPSLIPSLVGGQPIGAYYEWLDENVETNITYSYWLQDIDFNGGVDEHGPVKASVTGGNTIPTLPAVNTVAPTEALTNTPEPTPSETLLATIQVEPTSTATPRSAALPTQTATAVQVAPTVVPVQPTQSEGNNQQSTGVSETATSSLPPVQPTTSSPIVLNTVTLVSMNADPQVTGGAVDIVAEQVATISPQEISPEAVGEQPSIGINTQSIGSANPLPTGTDNSAAEETNAPANTSTLALIILVAAVLLALGGGIVVWIMLKPQAADHDNE